MICPLRRLIVIVGLFMPFRRYFARIMSGPASTSYKSHHPSLPRECSGGMSYSAQENLPLPPLSAFPLHPLQRRADHARRMRKGCPFPFVQIRLQHMLHALRA